MSLLSQIQDDVKDAMKAGERERVHALRLIVNELQKAAKENGGDEVEVLQRERKRRLEAAEAYRDGGAADRAEAEEREAEITRYLAANEEVGEVVTALEQQYDAFTRAKESGSSLLAGDQPLPTGEEIGQQFEQFLAGLDRPDNPNDN